jgi:hypothetical protein
MTGQKIVKGDYQQPTMGAPQSQTVGISTRTGRLAERGEEGGFRKNVERKTIAIKTILTASNFQHQENPFWMVRWVARKGRLRQHKNLNRWSSVLAQRFEVQPFWSRETSQALSFRRISYASVSGHHLLGVRIVHAMQSITR